jgi:hypothetical protein
MQADESALLSAHAIVSMDTSNMRRTLYQIENRVITPGLQTPTGRQIEAPSIRIPYSDLYN